MRLAESSWTSSTHARLIAGGPIATPRGGSGPIARTETDRERLAMPTGADGGLPPRAVSRATSARAEPPGADRDAAREAAWGEKPARGRGHDAPAWVPGPRPRAARGPLDLGALRGRSAGCNGSAERVELARRRPGAGVGSTERSRGDRGRAARGVWSSQPRSTQERLRSRFGVCSSSGSAEARGDW